jgi:RNA polymerase sigma-70 factor (ECF subfamily)
MSDKQQKDFELIERFLKGDESAFNLLAKRHQEKIYLLARRMLGNHLDADEVVQEVLLVIYNKLNTFKFESNFSTWLYRITMTRSINYLKRRALKNALSIFELKKNKSMHQDPLENVEGKEQIELIEKLLKKLPPKQRETFILKNFEELSYEEISEITGTSVGALKANYFHSINKLKKLLERYEKD